MDFFPFAYEKIAASTWAYMSSLLLIALFFKFNRFWSVRNFDLLLIILLAPGLLLVESGIRQCDNDRQVVQANVETVGAGVADGVVESDQSERDTPAAQAEVANFQSDSVSPPAAPAASRDSERFSRPGIRRQRWGYCWLFAVGAIFLVRMLIDPTLVRRPLLDPNLTSGGLVFLGSSLMVFLFANIVLSEPTADDVRGARDALRMLRREASDEGDVQQLMRQGPGYWLFNLFSVISTTENGGQLLADDPDEAAQLYRCVVAAKALAIASQILVVLGLVFFCRFHYGNFNVGVGIGTIYLMLPYTAMYTGAALHTLPAALLVWALVCFRRPWLAGVLVGLAIGVSYYPIFLLPLWCSFYWERGFKSFLIGVAISLAVGVIGLVFTSPDFTFFVYQLRKMFGFLWPRLDGLEGIWALGWSYWYRLPLLVAHIALSISFIFWPTEKNLGTLISYSAALMVAVQFWLGFGGGLHVAWYLPLALLVFFRPNLSGRVAVTELNINNWRKRAGTAEDLIPS